MLSTFACAAALVLPAAPATAQTAGDINRLNAAIQVCNSPMGAGMAECAKLRGRLGGGAFGGGLGGGPGGGKGAAAAGLLGALNAAMAPRPTVAAPTAPSADPQLIAACVKAAGGNTQTIQACLATASAPQHAAPGAPRLGPPIASGAAGPDAATAMHQAGQSYQACAAANPTNWRSCLPLLNGGQYAR